MFGFNKKAQNTVPDLNRILDQLVRNEISVTLNKANGSVTGSRFGGQPAAPDNFEWPRFEAENYDGETADRPLSFLCQINMESERHKLLGYANLIQGEMLTECERISRGMYCGDSKSYQSLSEKEKADIKKAAADWILLFQMASIEDDDYELMFGDVGNLYFYIRKDDLKNKRFDKVHFSLQCG